MNFSHHTRLWTSTLVLIIVNLFLFEQNISIVAIEPISTTAAVFAGAATLYGLYKGDRNPLEIVNCQYQECCHGRDQDTSFFQNQLQLFGLSTGNKSPYIRYTGYNDLRRDMNHYVHGQPLIMDPIYKSIMVHLKAEEPPKALVLYFSGWTGTGKSFVSGIIAKSLYSYGSKSKFVRKIMASYDFPSIITNNEDLEIYRRKLKDIIREQIQICERSLFIIDEVDKLPQGIIDTLKPFVDYNARIDGINYYKAIFVLLSNTGGKQLNDYAYKMYQTGKRRDDPTMVKDLEEIMTIGSFNEDGGLGNSSIIDKYLIDVFVPFLPLERQHVKMCIKDEIYNLNLDGKMKQPEIEKLIERVADELSYTPNDLQLYSKSGCKQVHKKVAIAHRMMNDE